MLSGSKAHLHVGGHTHIQMLRRHRDSLVLNPGSVGLAYNHLPAPDTPVRNPPWGEYAILTAENGRLGVDLRRVPFNVTTLLRAACEQEMPYAEWRCAEWDDASPR